MFNEKYVIEVFGCEDDLENGCEPVEIYEFDTSVECQAQQMYLYQTLPEGCVFTVSRQ